METVDLSIIPDKVSPVVYASQYDEGRVQRFMLYDGARPYTLSGEETIELRIRKPNNQTETIEIENPGDDYIDLTFTEQITDVAGDVYCKFSIDGISTKGFYIKVEPGPARIYTGYADGEIAEFETDLVENLIILNVELTPSQDLNGYDAPWAPGCGKNLLKTSGLSLIPPSGTAFSNSTKRTFSFDSYCLGLSHNNYYQPNKITSYSISENSVVMNSSVQAYGIGVPMKLEVGVRYNLSFVTTGGRIATSFYSLDGTALSFIDSATNNYYFTVPEDTAYVVLVFKVATNNIEATFSNIQVEKGSSATTWTPYSNICPITGHTEVKITRTGKNLIKNIIVQGQSANYVYLGQSNFNAHATHLKGGTYTINYKTRGSTLPSIYMRKQGASGTVKLVNYNTKATFTVEDGNYCFWLYRSDGVNYEDIYEPQIELGSEVTDYEAYTGSEIEVQLSKELCNAKAKLTTGKADITSRKVKISDLSWSYNSRYKFFNAIVDDIKKNTDASKKLEGLLHEGYVNRTAQQAGSGNVNGSIAGFNNNIRIKDLRFEDVTSFVNAVGDYYILYPLESSYEDTVSTPASLPTLIGINIVYSDSSPVEVAYHKSTPDGRR